MLYRSKLKRARVTVEERQRREKDREDKAQREARRTGRFIPIHALLGAASLAVGGNASMPLSDTTPPSAVRATGGMRGQTRRFLIYRTVEPPSRSLSRNGP